MALMNGTHLRDRKIEQIFATFDANHDGCLSKVRPMTSSRMQQQKGLRK